MRRFIGCLIGLAGLAGATAHAAPAPQYGPPPAWVDSAPIPATPPSEVVASQALLDDNQSRLGPEGDSYYNRRVERVMRPEGLRRLTSFGVTWSPETEQVTFHTLAIIRDGKVIDLLDGGKNMLVIRRERNLEQATLDGRLTASQQLEGIQVGDVLDVAWTVTRKDPLFQGRSYDAEGIGFAGLASRFRIRVSWPDNAPVRWKATAGLPTPIVRRRDGRTWLEVDARNITAPRPPVGAPLRFRRLGLIEASSFQSWADVSKMMAPLFAKASALAPDSPLKAQAAAIAAASPDPKARAFAALQLVEDKTRYFLLAMGDGGYVPAPADQTWARRFGDCKAKTVLLLALLNELGIKAEPALVSLGGGDGMDERVPSVAAFNHVLVRAEIDGKVYWLDGTRAGDRAGLDALRPPPHRWALPVRAQGADLEPIVVPPYVSPLIETFTRFDVSKGTEEPAPVRGVTRYYGEAAIPLRALVSTNARADLDRNFRQSMSRASWIEIEAVDWRDDAARDAFEVSYAGKAELDWRRNPDVGALEYRIAAGGRINGYPRREPGPNSDAPYAVSYPVFQRVVMEFALPEGKGFTIRGPNDDVSLGGYRIRRVSTLTGGVARFESELSSVTPEVSAAEAESATRSLRLLNQDDTLIRAPAPPAPPIAP